MLSPNYVSGSQPDSHLKGEGRFLLLLFDETQIFLKGKHNLIRPFLCYGIFCDFLKRHNLLIKLQTCPCFHSIQYTFKIKVASLSKIHEAIITVGDPIFKKYCNMIYQTCPKNNKHFHLFLLFFGAKILLFFLDMCPSLLI